MKIAFNKNFSTIPRLEYKFIISKNNLNNIYNFFYLNKISSTFKKRSIHSVYFDSNDFSCAQENLIGLSCRKKYRLRIYNYKQDDQIINAIFEVKLKKNGLGHKIKKEIDILGIKQNLFKKKNLDLITKNLIKNYFLEDKINFNPKILIEYNRCYFKDRLNKISVTLDENIFFKDLFFTTKKIFLKNVIIMEIKFDEKDTNYCSKFFKDLDITRSKSSKYLIGFNKLFYENKLSIY